MANFSHLNLDDRYKIQNMLDDKCSLSSIAKQLGKDKSTVSKEIRRNRQTVRSGCKGQNYNNCANRFTCTKSYICRDFLSINYDHEKRGYKFLTEPESCKSFAW